MLLIAAAMDGAEAHVNAESRRSPSTVQFQDEYLSPLVQQKVVLVMGSEGQGVRPEILQESHRISIPMQQSMDSLNVAAAGSMIMFALSPRTIEGVLTQVSNFLRP